MNAGTMARRLPPLNGLKAFEAAARSESFTRAAKELNVTQGAVSHQVKALEDTLGLKLFHRERQQLSSPKRDAITWLSSAMHWTRSRSAPNDCCSVGRAVLSLS